MSLFRILAGFVVIWLILDRAGANLTSTRGEAGLLICALAVVAALAVELLISKRSLGQAWQALGLVTPAARSFCIGIAIALTLLAFYPVFSWITGIRITMREGWLWMVPGLFAQGGIAEETVFRGYLFRHLRATRSFSSAAVLSAAVFTAVHLLLFLTLAPQLALASTLLAIAVSFPLAHLFELGGNSILVPALLHFTIQGSIKLVEIPAPSLMPTAVAWMAVSATIPYAAFVAKRGRAAEIGSPR